MCPEGRDRGGGWVPGRAWGVGEDVGLGAEDGGGGVPVGVAVIVPGMTPGGGLI